MKKINFIFTALLFSGTLLFTSCTSESETQEPKGDYENGLLISGEGSGAGSGSVSFISDDYTVNNSKIYNSVNNSDFGTYLQSMAFDNDNAYIVVDNQNSVTVVDRYTFELSGHITGELSTPRYMVVNGSLGYVTNWGDASDETDDFIAVVNINTFEVLDKISVGNGPERIVMDNGNLYVSHKGAWSTNNIISVIDASTYEVTTITVHDNPDDMYVTSSNDLLVLSEGRTLYDASYNVIGHTLASISTINLDTNTTTSTLEFPEGEHPSSMVVANDIVYYSLGNDIYSVATTATTTSSTTLFIGADSYLYGLAVEGTMLYTLDASFSDVSTLNVFDLTTNEKTMTLEAPLGASKIYFN